MSLNQIKTFTNGCTWALSLFSVPLLAMLMFALLQNSRGGVQISERVRKAGGSVLLNQWVMEYGYWWLNMPVHFLVRYRVSPNVITAVGFAVVCSGCIILAQGYFGLAGMLLLCGSLADMLDGLVARQRHMCSDAGEFVDSMADRYADVAAFSGLSIYYAGQPLALALVLAAMVGSVMVSYARAKAESLGIHNTPGGLMRRAERAVYLGFSILLGPTVATYTEPPSAHPHYYLVLLTCSLIALLANFSALQMSWSVYQGLQALQAQRRKLAQKSP